MHQLIHLLIVDRDRLRTLAGWHRSRWLLPVIATTERVRAAPLAARWLADRGIRGAVVGQWLGRTAANDRAMDWLLVVDAIAASATIVPNDMRWTPLRALMPADALLDYQQWAVKMAIREDLPSVNGPFGSMTWLEAVREWICDADGPLLHEPSVYKATAYEVVLGIHTPLRRGYFKGLRAGVSSEAAITRALSTMFPRSFAPTVAVEQRSDGSTWWLTEHCTGTALASEITSARALRAVSALARVQRDISAERIGLPCEEVDAAAVARWARALVNTHIAAHIAATCHDAIDTAERTMACVGLPRSWIGLDLDTGNVLVDDDSVRFIDLDHSRIGSAPLALLTLFRRMRRVTTNQTLRGWIGPISSTYEHEIQLRLTEHWPALAFASLLLECHLGWHQLLRKSEQGEVHGALNLGTVRTAQRLQRAALRALIDPTY
jgi:hypothetical protein